MPKLLKGFKKKHKKDKNDDLFDERELAKYKAEKAKREAEGGTSSGGEQWKEFAALTAGLDTVLAKTQDDLERIKSESFYKKQPTKAELEEEARLIREEEERIRLEEEAERAEEERIEKEARRKARGKKKKKKTAEFGEKFEEGEESDGSYCSLTPEGEVRGVVHIEESEPEAPDELFDTDYLEDVKLAYIPESPVEDKDEFFDTTFAEKYIPEEEKKRLAEEQRLAVERTKRKPLKLVSLGCAVDVLSGAKDLSDVEVKVSEKAVKRIKAPPKPVIDLGPPEENKENSDPFVSEQEPKNTVLDLVAEFDIAHDIEDIEDEFSDVIKKVKKQRQAEENDEDDDEFDFIATERHGADPFDTAVADSVLCGDEQTDPFDTSVVGESEETKVGPVDLLDSGKQLEERVQNDFLLEAVEDTETAVLEAAIVQAPPTEAEQKTDDKLKTLVAEFDVIDKPESVRVPKKRVEKQKPDLTVTSRARPRVNRGPARPPNPLAAAIVSAQKPVGTNTEQETSPSKEIEEKKLISSCQPEEDVFDLDKDPFDTADASEILGDPFDTSKAAELIGEETVVIEDPFDTSVAQNNRTEVNGTVEQVVERPVTPEPVFDPLKEKNQLSSDINLLDECDHLDISNNSVLTPAVGKKILTSIKFVEVEDNLHKDFDPLKTGFVGAISRPRTKPGRPKAPSQVNVSGSFDDFDPRASEQISVDPFDTAVAEELVAQSDPFDTSAAEDLVDKKDPFDTSAAEDLVDKSDPFDISTVNTKEPSDIDPFDTTTANSLLKKV